MIAKERKMKEAFNKFLDYYSYLDSELGVELELKYVNPNMAYCSIKYLFDLEICAHAWRNEIPKNCFYEFVECVEKFLLQNNWRLSALIGNRVYYTRNKDLNLTRNRSLRQ